MNCADMGISGSVYPGKGVEYMPKSKKKEKNSFDPATMKPEDMLKFEIATELGLADKVISGGWRSLTAKESGRIGGLITKRKKELKKEEADAESLG